MSLHHKLLTLTNIILQYIRKFFVKLGIVSPNRLRVLIYHDIHQNEEHVLETQLNWLKKNWNIISPSNFTAMISGKKPIKGDNLLITFDDGLISNRIVAEKILNPMGIKAIFFVISDFVSIKDQKAAHKFIANHIMPELKLSEIPVHYKNMQWDDLKALSEQGHTIGSHTKKHIRLSNCSSLSEIEDEMITSADTITKRLGINVEHFAFTFGDIDSFNAEALKVAKSRFRYVYSGVRGNNAYNVSPLAIRRDSAAYLFSDNRYVLFNNKLLDAFLGGFADFKYATARKTMDRWVRKS